MKVKELIEQLSKFDPELELWHSDGGYCEGSMRSIEPVKILAIDAGLDGDEVDSEYFYVYDEEDMIDNPEKHGYEKTGDGYSKYIVLLRSQLDE